MFLKNNQNSKSAPNSQFSTMAMPFFMHLSSSLVVAFGVSSARSKLPSLSFTQCASSSSGKRKKLSTHKKQSRKKEVKEKNDLVVGFGAEKKTEMWTCVQGCGACCKLDKGPEFGTPEEIFDDPADVQLFRSMVGSDGWCINYEKATRRCSIYEDRPYFCRVEEQVFQNLYGIDKKRFNKEACRSCRDTIKEIYGFDSIEMETFNLAVKSSSSQLAEDEPSTC